MINKHFTIPIFVPELACPFQCIYCNQKKISGKLVQPDEQEVMTTIETYLQTMSGRAAHIEIGFFGGNFTGIDKELQQKFLKIANKYKLDGQIQGIRLSTRPDYIDQKTLDFLKMYGVTCIELGAQSLDDEVLSLTERGHDHAAVANAAKLITDAGFELGLQMMLGLPGDTLDKALFTAREIIRLGASNTRIYPCLIIRDTALDRLFQEGKYAALDMETAVEWSKHVLLEFEKAGVTVLRVGLHPSEAFSSGGDLTAGPYHVSFKEFVLTSIWKDILLKQLQGFSSADSIRIGVNPREINYAIGYHGANKNLLKERYHSVKFYGDSNITERNCMIDHGS